MVVVKRATMPYRNCGSKPTRQTLLNISMVVAVILGMLTAYRLMYYLHVGTYVWQTTTLGAIIDPVERRTCEIRNHKSSLSDESAPVPSSQESADKPKLNIGLLMLYNDQDGTWDSELMTRVLKNRDKYANKHGYKIVVANNLLDRSRPAAWSKLLAMDKYLDSFDYLFYIDMDIVIMNMTISAEHFIDLDRSKDFIMTEDWNGPNTGAWLAKRSNFTHWFLQKAWNSTQFIPRTSKEGIPYPFEYEQRAVHYLLQTDIWRQRGLESYPDAVNVRKHFQFLPQCAMNSYILYPYYWNGDRELAHYVPGDFLVHFAGKKGAFKTNLLEHFLSLAEQSP